MDKVSVPAYSSAVPRAFCPSSLEWWSTHLPEVVVIRAKANGNLMVRISKPAIGLSITISVIILTCPQILQTGDRVLFQWTPQP